MSRHPSTQVERAWVLLHRFVESQNRRAELFETLGFRLGGGRGKVLVGLGDGPMTLRQIATTHGVDAPYATVVVDQLEARGLVARRPHPDDRRRKLVELTEDGRAALAATSTILDRPPPELDALSEADVDRLVTILGRLAGDR